MADKKEVSPVNVQGLLYAAFAKAQADYGKVEKNRDATGYDESGEPYAYKYADLEQLLSVTRPALSDNDLVFFQYIKPITSTNYQHLVTVIAHKDGGFIESVVPTKVPDQFNDLKQYGSQLTYLRRYTAEAMLGVASYHDDNDMQGSSAAFIGAARGNGHRDRSKRFDPGHNYELPIESAKDLAIDGEKFYSDELFERDFPEWEEAIKSGLMNRDDLLHTIQNTAPFSDVQLAQFMAIGSDE